MIVSLAGRRRLGDAAGDIRQVSGRGSAVIGPQPPAEDAHAVRIARRSAVVTRATRELSVMGLRTRSCGSPVQDASPLDALTPRELQIAPGRRAWPEQQRGRGRPVRLSQDRRGSSDAPYRKLGVRSRAELTPVLLVNGVSG